MNENQFSAMLALIVPPIIELITKNSNVDENKIIHLFYKSKLYKELSDEKSKLWHYGPVTWTFHLTALYTALIYRKGELSCSHPHYCFL